MPFKKKKKDKTKRRESIVLVPFPMSRKMSSSSYFGTAQLLLDPFPLSPSYLPP